MLTYRNFLQKLELSFAPILRFRDNWGKSGNRTVDSICLAFRLCIQLSYHHSYYVRFPRRFLKDWRK